MIYNFIKDVERFYKEVYQSDYKNLSLEELKTFDSKMKEFYKNQVLNLNSSEEDKINSFLAYEILNFYPSILAKDEYSYIYLKYINEAISCLETNKELLRDTILKFVSNVSLPVSKTIKRNTKIDNHYRDIVLNYNLDNYNYLYCYGEKITDNHFKIVDYFNKIDNEKITSIAKCTVDAFFRGAKNGNIDLSKKSYALLYYPLGFEKVAKKVIEILDGKLDIILRVDGCSFDKQVNYNHRYDYNLYLSKEYTDKYLSQFDSELDINKDVFKKYAGPICIESFGENRFIPVNGNEIFKKDTSLTNLNNEFDTKFSVLYMNKIRKNTTFTIISYPCPEIGKDFEEIFDKTVEINNLDNSKYQSIHQCIIDVLDTAKYVHVTGKNGNKTDITVSLTELKDPKTQTIFENCCADVNVPVGEVFTSPKLNGTNGILHVSEIYLNGWKFVDLQLKIKDGFIEEYSCKNFPTDKENNEYVNEHLLFDNKTLPMGEFAIGTNTHAYVMGNKFKINDKLDILIAEKTGPHFAFGDTCYSMQENVVVFNPDGKEIIAKDNEVSIKRLSDDPNEQEKAYFGVHTDVTIPYYELNDIVAICDDSETYIIKNGKFVLKGTEELNIEGI